MTEQNEIDVSAKKFVDRVLKEFETGGAYIAMDGDVPMGIPGNPYERVDIMGYLHYVPPGTIGRWQVAVTRLAEEAGLINISGTVGVRDQASFVRPMYGAMRPVRKAKRASCRCPAKPAKRKVPRRA